MFKKTFSTTRETESQQRTSWNTFSTKPTNIPLLFYITFNSLVLKSFVCFFLQSYPWNQTTKNKVGPSFVERWM